jgi:TonB family protein
VPRLRQSSLTAFALVLLTSTQAFAQDPQPASPPAAPRAVPPKEISHVDAVYPADLVAQGVHADVVLVVTVDAEGHVSDIEVRQSGGAELDTAASDAMRKWLFSPALRDGKPVASRIRVPFHFAPPGPAAPPENANTPLVEGHTTSQTGSGPAAVSPAPASVQQIAPAASPPQKSAPVTQEADVDSVSVQGQATTPEHGASDINFKVGALGVVPKKNATELLKTAAPGIVLTNEGGEGHAEQVFMRGFDAREGQDVEFSVGGVPINESGNLHGNGYADTHFIIPELVERLRVNEGPYDPHQGNYAVAGSADYQLGLEKRGLTAKATYGSFNTSRLLLLWGPNGQSTGTFAGGEIYHTDGFGQDRDADRGSVMGQYEGKLGERGSYRITAQGYATHYHSAGVIREDDYDSGKIGFYDSYDQTTFAHEQTPQGGDASRFSVAGDIETRSGDTTFKQQVFLIDRSMRLLENFTGFLLDVQEPLQSIHIQRGDEIDLHSDEITFGARGSARYHTTLFDQKQELELGYFARGDKVHGTQQRIEAATGIPYLTETDLSSDLGDLGVYADTDLRATKWLAFRGGLRGDLFTYDVVDNCAAHTVSVPSSTNPPIDQSCLTQQNFGRPREADQESGTSSTALLPRGTVLVGPFEKFTLSASYGAGVRSIDPSYITQDVKTPFASVTSYEVGQSYAGGVGKNTLVARSVFFQTHVDKDLIFDQTVGRNVLGAGTTRTGWSGSGRFTGSFFDESANLTFVRSTYDDTHLLVAYVPDVVLRSDTVVFTDLPWSFRGKKFRGTLGAGVTYVGPRPLPFGERSDSIFTIDATAALAWTHYEFSLSAMNLLDSKYKLGEYNYASDFHSQPQATLVPVREFTAGAPLSVYASFAVNFGGPQ